jgi:His/Glu/Gln/Arg/opine family amino acid ABC transporter permease subunit
MALFSLAELGYCQQLANGAVITIELAISGFALALVSGTIVGLATLSRHWLIQALWRGYAFAIMGVPSLLVIFLFYYGGDPLLSVEVTPFAAALAALVFVELVRGAIRNVPRGQFGRTGARSAAPRPDARHLYRHNPAGGAARVLTLLAAVNKQQHSQEHRETEHEETRLPRGFGRDACFACRQSGAKDPRIEVHRPIGSGDRRSDLDDGLRDPQPRLHGVRHAVWPDGRGRRICGHAADGCRTRRRE